MARRKYATWDTHDLHDPAAPPPTLTFDITLMSPKGQVLFRDTRSFDTGPALKPDPKAHPGKKVRAVSKSEIIEIEEKNTKEKFIKCELF